MRIAFALSGLHRVDRGAEVAFTAIASELARAGHQVTLFGSGAVRPDQPYRFVHVSAVAREKFERWPKIPAFRNETAWEEASFVAGLLARYHPADFDITATCAYPFTNWALRRPPLRGRRPRHVFITQNGDWPAYSDRAEFRLFGCDGLICTNPDYFERNRARYRSALIPNGVDLDCFGAGASERDRFGLPKGGPIVLMVSALIPSKKVADGIAAVAQIPNANLLVAGDGPLRDDLSALARELLPGRYWPLTLPAAEMPALYRTADAFMHLSTDESFGNVFVEAMASGLPIVAYDTPRTRWIVGDHAFFADSREALPAALRMALGVGHEAAAGMRERARAFGWPAVAGLYNDFFNELLQ